jgi:hypothetical protein
MNILNKGFHPFAENGNVTIYTKVLTGDITEKRLRIIQRWIETVNKKTKHICYGWLDANQWLNNSLCEYHINIEVLNSNEI